MSQYSPYYPNRRGKSRRGWFDGQGGGLTESFLLAFQLNLPLLLLLQTAFELGHASERIADSMLVLYLLANVVGLELLELLLQLDRVEMVVHLGRVGRRR
jgi:hypothetical protein